MKIGIYGGTFNPIHSGHLYILKEFIRRRELERVLMIPAGIPPHKQVPDLAGAEERLAMCALGAGEITEAAVEVSDMEICREGKSYTADTLSQLKTQYPEDELFLLMGEDMFLTLDSWYHPEIICSLASLCVSPRSGEGMERLLQKKAELERSFGAVCYVEDIPFFPVSSTQIRELSAEGKSLEGLVPPPVEEYIRSRGLYQKVPSLTYEACEKKVRQLLTEKRFFHSQCVAEEAARLAKRYGADPEKARLAGILHDVMKDTPHEEQLKIMQRFGIILSKTQRENPKLWHAVCGAAFLERQWGVDDREILDAVRLHTSGGRDMTVLEKVLFVADYISADRDYPGIEIMRASAERSLEETIVRGVAWTMNDLSGQGMAIDPDSVYAYNDALSILKEGNDLVFSPGKYGFPEIEIRKEGN